jgi:hypothetical protein
MHPCFSFSKRQFSSLSKIKKSEFSMPSTEHFSDIESHWAQKCIVQLRQRQFVSGYPDGTFRPEETITRAEFAAILQKAFPNVQSVRAAIAFTDVPENHWANKAIKFATERKFFEGYPDGTFKPNQLLPRVQAIAILANGLNYKPTTAPSETLRNYFEDAREIPDYAKKAIAAASENFLVVNYPDIRKLRPNHNATRGEVAALLCQALQIRNVTPPQYVVGNEPLVISSKFDEVEAFSDGVAWVKVGKKWGVIDKNGKFLIEPEYYNHFAFFSGLALVTIGGKYRYIDKKGKIAIALNFDNAYSFSGGLASVSIGGKFGYIDTKGQIVIQPQFEQAQNFSEGLAAVKYQGKVGFIDKTGKFVIQPQFNWADPFSDGVAWAATGDKHGFIDKTGKLTQLNPELRLTDATGAFSEGLARVSVTGGDGFIDKTGKLVIPARFQGSKSFSEGLAAVYLDGKYGFIDRAGKVVIPVAFDSADSFSQGLARVGIGDKFGYINKVGNFVIKPQFIAARDFSEGLAAVYVGRSLGEGVDGGKWGYIHNPLK